MKLLIALSTLMATFTAFAECRVYVQLASVLKENERILAIDLTSKHLKELGYTVTPTLEKTDAVLKVSLNPVLDNGRFQYEAALELMHTSGLVNLAKSQDGWTAGSFKKALESLPECR